MFSQHRNPHFESHPGSSQHWRRPCRGQEGRSPGRKAAPGLRRLSPRTPSAPPPDFDSPAEPTTPTTPHSQNQFLSSAGSWHPSPPSLSNTAQTPPRRKAPATLQAEVSFLHPAGGCPPRGKPVHPYLRLRPLHSSSSTHSFHERLSGPKGTFSSGLLKQVRCTELLCSLRSACDRCSPFEIQ